MKNVLGSQFDFRSQKGRIQELIESRGHETIFLPKFHPELNYIEMFWGWTKAYVRKRNDTNWNSFVNLVKESHTVCPISTIRRFARNTFRHMDAYRKGLTGHLAIWAAKKYSSHRRIPANYELPSNQN